MLHTKREMSQFPSGLEGAYSQVNSRCPEKKKYDTCNIPMVECPPDTDELMIHPSPEPYMGWCWVTALLYEFIVNTLFSTLVYWSRLAPIGPAAVGTIQGLGLVALIAVFWERDAGYFNPALTLPLVLLGKLPGKWIGFVVYTIAQALGWLVGVLFVLAISPGFNKDLGLGSPVIAGALDVGQAALAELIGSFIFILVAVMMIGFRDLYEIHHTDEVKMKKENGNTTYHRKKARKPFRIVEGTILGFFLVAIVSSLDLFTGGVLNPFSWLWSAAISGNLNGNWWVYAIMPLVAGVAVFLISFPVFYYEKLRHDTFKKKESQD